MKEPSIMDGLKGLYPPQILGFMEVFFEKETASHGSCGSAS